jgi:hypothetical protein
MLRGVTLSPIAGRKRRDQTYDQGYCGNNFLFASHNDFPLVGGSLILMNNFIISAPETTASVLHNRAI